MSRPAPNRATCEKRHREKLLKENNISTTTHQQRTITNFFSLMTLSQATRQPKNTFVESQTGNYNPHGTKSTKDTLLGFKLGQSKGGTIDLAIKMCWTVGHEQLCHQQIKAIITDDAPLISEFFYILERPHSFSKAKASDVSTWSPVLRYLKFFRTYL